MNDVAIVEWRVLPAKEARVVLIDEERKVWTQFAAFVAKALGERGMGAHQAIERLPYGAGVKRDVSSATCETAVDAVQ